MSSMKRLTWEVIKSRYGLGSQSGTWVYLFPCYYTQVAGRYFLLFNPLPPNPSQKRDSGKAGGTIGSYFLCVYSSGCGPLFFVHTHHYTLIIGCVGLIGLTRRGVKRPLHFLGNKKARPLSWGEKYFSFRIFYHKIRFTDHFL